MEAAYKQPERTTEAWMERPDREKRRQWELRSRREKSGIERKEECNLTKAIRISNATMHAPSTLGEVKLSFENIVEKR
ncbi:hypothetical protein FQA39_LY04572 [Lamprigera yunnana]|nr:hypothetical protein FQA39_LY04572 [Lamprigera yunnana]